MSHNIRLLFNECVRLPVRTLHEHVIGTVNVHTPGYSLEKWLHYPTLFSKMYIEINTEIIPHSAIARKKLLY